MLIRLKGLKVYDPAHAISGDVDAGQADSERFRALACGRPYFAENVR